MCLANIVFFFLGRRKTCPKTHRRKKKGEEKIREKAAPLAFNFETFPLFLLVVQQYCIYPSSSPGSKHWLPLFSHLFLFFPFRSLVAPTNWRLGREEKSGARGKKDGNGTNSREKRERSNSALKHTSSRENQSRHLPLLKRRLKTTKSKARSQLTGIV